MVRLYEDSLISGKIARVAVSPGSSGLLKKKREEVTAVSFVGRKTPPEVHHIAKVVLGLPKVLPILLHAI